MPWFASRYYRAVASFFFFKGGGRGRGMGGNLASAEGTNFVGGSGGILPQKIFKFEGSEALFSATFQEMCPKNRPRI